VYGFIVDRVWLSLPDWQPVAFERSIDGLTINYRAFRVYTRLMT